MFKNTCGLLLKSVNTASQALGQSCRGIKQRGEYFRRLGYHYVEQYKGGLLPRPDPKLDDTPLPMPEFKRRDPWSAKKATFGQNDYVDILGDGNVHPVDLIHGPPWLIGFQGNELQRITRQLKFQGKELRAKNPHKFHDLTKRVRYLMWRYNHKFGGIKK